MRLSEKCRLEVCDLRWVAGIAYIKNSQTYRFCCDEHLQLKLQALPWPKTLFAEARDER